MKKLFLLIALYSACINLFAQAERKVARHLSMENGLSNNYVTCLAQDSQGCVWIGTVAGLNRFNGFTFDVYNSCNSEIGNESVHSIYYNDADNELWIGTMDDGLTILDVETSQFRHINKIGEKAISSVIDIIKAADGGIWVIPYSGDIIHYDSKAHRFAFLADKGVKHTRKQRWCAIDDGNGHLLVGHTATGLEVIDISRHRSESFLHDAANSQSLPNDRIYSLFKDSRENIWVGTSSGLALFNPSAGTFSTFSHIQGDESSIIADPIYAITETSDGKLWLGSDIGGASILDLNSLALNNKSNIRFSNMSLGSGLSSRNIRSIMQDRYGNIWVGNYSSGLDFFDHQPKPFQTLQHVSLGQFAPLNKSIWGLCKDSQGRIWAGGENEIYLISEGLVEQTFSIAGRITRPYGQIFCCSDDGDGGLLLGIFDDGLYRFYPQTNAMKRVIYDVDNLDIITIYKESDSLIWIGTEYGIYTYGHGMVKRQDSINKMLPDRSVYAIQRDKRGQLWVAGYSKGIVIFDKLFKNRRLLSQMHGGFPNDVNDLFIDSRNHAWVATRKGLAYIPDTDHPEHFRILGQEEGLTDLFVRSICEDSNGNIWISCNKTIALWIPDEQRFLTFDYRNGIPSGNFIESSCLLADNGDLYFGSLAGACYFKPEAFVRPASNPQVLITSCKAFTSNTAEDNISGCANFVMGSVELPFDQNTLRVSFGVTDYAMKGLVEYAYFIDGINESWTSTNGDQEVMLRDLRPGHYTFRVKARILNGKWDEEHIATMAIRILPPWYLSLWAWMVYTILLVAIVAIIMRQYTRHLRVRNALALEKERQAKDNELNQERLRFYTNVTHELRTPLTLILGPLEDLVNDRNLPTAYARTINTIHQSAEKLLNLVSELLEFRKTETQHRTLTVSRGNIAQTVREVGLRFKELNRNNDVEVVLDIDASIAPLYYDAEVITIILNNLMSNAMKYTTKGSVVMALKDDGEEAKISVTDTGYGISREALPHIFERYYQAEGKHQASGTGIGLSLAKSMAELHHARLTVESREEKGSRFSLYLLKAEEYVNALHKEQSGKEEAQRTTSTAESPETAAEGKKKLLVVEDNDDIREYVANCFDGEFQVAQARNGQEGLDMVGNQAPDIVISDIMMPLMDGIEMCRKMKTDIATSHIPIILLTAKDALTDKEKGYDSGADSYLTKPFTAKLLRSRVKNILDNRCHLAALLATTVGAETSGKNPPLPEENDKYKALSRLDRDFLSRLEQKVMDNIGNDQLDMPTLASEMAMSHSTLYRKIKGLLGMTGNEYIRRVRLAHAHRLLTRDEGLSMAEVAYACGFNDVPYFRKCYREIYKNKI